MKAMRKRVLSLIALAAIFTLLLTACGSAAKLTEYSFGTDKVPAVNAVIGEERKVRGVEIGIANGVRYRQYTYQSDSVLDDLLTYSLYLQDNGWLVIPEGDLYGGEGEMRLARDSADEGKILIISVEFYPGGYVIRVNKLAGSLPPN
ncbi:MAG: hypothetical protein FWE85_06275 [Clostridiales bacterium]|nr:hypothetical protein [Clostridiales bacterium]